MGKLSNLTIKGQVTIPKDVRDALGLRAGEPVEFGWNAAGEAVIRKPAMDAMTPEARRRMVLARLDAAAARLTPVDVEDADTLMAVMREPVPLDDDLER